MTRQKLGIIGEQTDVIKRVGKDEERKQAGGITGK